MKGSVRLGKILGIPVEIHFSWLIIFAVVTMWLVAVYFPTRFPGWGSVAYWSISVFTSLLFFGSVLFHELAHSVVALSWGIPVRSITLFIFGGIASIEREPERPLAEFLIAAAGPASSLLLALAFGGLWLLGRTIDLRPLVGMSMYLAGINASLAIFNLVPGFPLDGGRIFRSILWARTHNMNRATRLASGVGRGVAWLLIAAAVGLFVTGDWTSGVWLGFIGWFLDNAANQSGQQARLREALTGYTAGDFASFACEPVSGDLPLDWIVRDYVVPQEQECFMVMDGENNGPVPEGLVTVSQIRQVPRQRWGWTRLSQIMTPFHHMEPVGAEQTAYSVLERMVSEGQTLLPVMQGTRFLGLVRRDNLMRFAQRQRRR